MMIATVIVAGCSSGESRANLLIVLMDTLRPDRLGCYGHERDTSPTIDSLASSGVLFERAFATSDYTQASTASLFTGRYPLAHGYVNAGYTLDPDNETLAEVLGAAGYATGAFIANGLAGRKYGMDQGFAHHFEKNRALAEELVEEASRFVCGEASLPTFAYLHFLDVHDPYRTPTAHRDRYAPPGGFAQDMLDTLLLEERHAAAWWGEAQGWWNSDAEQRQTEAYFSDYSRLYDGAISYWDSQVARLLADLEACGQAERTIVVIVADHGEQLMEHGYFGHANSGYDVGLQIPLVIYDPRLARGLDEAGGGVRVAANVSLVDLMPTLLDRLGVAGPAQMQGVSRWGLVTDSTAAQPPGPGRGAVRDIVHTEGTFFGNRPFHTLTQTVRQGGWKLILDRLRDAKELYHLDADPGEQRDLYDDRPDQVNRLAALIRAQYEQNRVEMEGRRLAREDRGEEKLRELVALGYVGGGQSLRRRPSEFQPMRPVELTRYGPFGDEGGLEVLGSRLDFATGEVVTAQIVRGLSDNLGRRDSRGLWFDRRATFLMRRGEEHNTAVVDTYIDTLPGSGHPSRLELLVDGAVVETRSVGSPGPVTLSAAIPATGSSSPYLHVEVRAQHLFVYQLGPSPRTHVYAAYRVRRVQLEE